MDKVGKDGVITVEESKGLAFETEYVEGMQIDRGYLSPYFITNTERMEAEITNPYLLICDKKISSAQDLLPILEKLVQIGKRRTVVIAEDVDGEALATLVLNKLRGTINALAVKAPGFGDRRKAMLREIAILTGGQVITEELGRTLESVMLDDLGQADKIVSNKDETTIVGGHGAIEAITARILANCAPKLRPRPVTMIARNCRSGWPNWRWCRHCACRRRHRNRVKGEEAPCGGCPERYACRCRRRHCAGRRGCAHQGDAGPGYDTSGGRRRP